MTVDMLRKSAAKGIVSEPEEIAAIIRAFGQLRLDQLYTERMRKFNCLDCIVKGADLGENRSPETLAMSYQDIMSAAAAAIMGYDKENSSLLVPWFSPEQADLLDSLSYLYYDYLPSLKD